MNGQNLVDLVTSILGDEAPDPTYILYLINLARLRFEKRRPWMVLKKFDNSQTVTAGNTYTTAFNIPSDFVRYVGESSLSEGSILLFDGNDSLVNLTEIPIELVLRFKNHFGKFAPDYGNKTFTIMGLVPQTYTIYQYYIADFGDITLTTTWAKFNNYNPNFAAVLAFDTAARWRLGTDYDDVAAFNADDNGRMVNEIFDAMATWDNELALSAVNSLNYAGENRGRGNFGPRGVRANS